MELYFLRHGLAGQHGDPRYKDDSLRPLTEEGQKKMFRAAQGMKALDLKFDIILSSPYLRAKQTAQIVAQTYQVKNKDFHLTDNLLPPASVKKILQEIRSDFPKSESVLLVGHEPHMTQMIAELLKSNGPLCIDLKKGGLCCMSLDLPWGQNAAVLHWLLTPTQLGLL